MSYPSGYPGGYPGPGAPPSPPPPPPMVEIVPVTEIPCPHCASVCFKGRVECHGVVLHTFGRYLLTMGYLLLIGLAVSLAVIEVHNLWVGWHTGVYLTAGEEFPVILSVLALAGVIVAGHLLAMERQVWICAACGSLFDRTERVELIHAERQRKKQEAK